MIVHYLIIKIIMFFNEDKIDRMFSDFIASNFALIKTFY